MKSSEDLEVRPVEALPCDPEESVRACRVVAVSADSDRDCCAPC